MSSNVEKLAVIQGGKQDAEDARVKLNEILGLADVGLEIRSALISGTNSSARAVLTLSDGAQMEFDSLREMATTTLLSVELAACTGATPKITRQQALQVVKYVRKIAKWQRTMTATDLAIDWGCSYLQAADKLHANLEDQLERWGAFSKLNETDPAAGGKFSATATIVLVDVADGARWVRSSWFYTFLREQRHAYNQSQVISRMAQVGWQRRGASGRIKATCPSRDEALGWAFFIVPAEWHDASSGSEVPTGVSIDTRAKTSGFSRVETGTDRNPGTRQEERV